MDSTFQAHALHGDMCGTFSIRSVLSSSKSSQIIYIWHLIAWGFGMICLLYVQSLIYLHFQLPHCMHSIYRFIIDRAVTPVILVLQPYPVSKGVTKKCMHLMNLIQLQRNKFSEKYWTIGLLCILFTIYPPVFRHSSGGKQVGRSWTICTSFS